MRLFSKNRNFQTLSPNKTFTVGLVKKIIFTDLKEQFVRNVALYSRHDMTKRKGSRSDIRQVLVLP